MITAGQLHQAWRALPVGSLDDVIGAWRCLVLAPHPDDESLGCGGLIAACCAAGRPPVVTILTDGSRSHPGSRRYPPAKLAALRECEVIQAMRVLGLPPERLVCLRQPDSAVPDAGVAFETIVRRVADLLRHFDCASILAPWRDDPHCDHAAASRIASQAACIAGVRHLSYPVWGWLLPADQPVDADAVRGWRLDVTPWLATKSRAIAAHASQYGNVVTDDPDGFQLPHGLLQACETPYETFLVA